MKLNVSVRHIVMKITRRHLCSKNINPLGIFQERGADEMSKNLKSFLSQESPLKNFKEGTEWATTPYPHGTSEGSKKSESNEIDPDTTSVIMFPGQGNQYVGMGKNLMEHSVVRDMFESASNILGYDLKKLCFHGPAEKLNDTEYCQPATLVCSLAAVEELKVKYPSALSHCIAVCGFSVGELAALVFAGCISFDSAIHITRVRAKAMKTCSKAVASGMTTLLYGADSTLKAALADAKEECIRQGISDPVCQVANYLIPECRVIAGHIEALNYIENNMEKYKLRRASRLPVSGAFHTDLMKDAQEPFRKALANIEMREPLVPVYSNEFARPYGGSNDIRKKLPRQICKPVKWEQTMNYIYERPSGTPFPHSYECGPGRSLSTLLKRLNSPAGRKCHNVFA